jgi:hypothetical protein
MYFTVRSSPDCGAADRHLSQTSRRERRILDIDERHRPAY